MSLDFLCRQILERKRVSSDHVAQRINEQIRTAPAIKPELHFLKVGLPVLRRNPMPPPESRMPRSLPGCKPGPKAKQWIGFTPTVAGRV
jgi:hypothetical protein